MLKKTATELSQLIFDITEETGITSDAVLLCGAASDLRNINKIELGTIDISGASANVIKNFDITGYLPAGITAYQTTDVSVSAEILKYQIKNKL